MVLESQLPHKIVNSLSTVTYQIFMCRFSREVVFLKLINEYIVSDKVAAFPYCWILEILDCNLKGCRALLRIPSTEGRCVCLCWAPSKPKGPQGPRQDPRVVWSTTATSEIEGSERKRRRSLSVYPLCCIRIRSDMVGVPHPSLLPSLPTEIGYFPISCAATVRRYLHGRKHPGPFWG